MCEEMKLFVVVHNFRIFAVMKVIEVTSLDMPEVAVYSHLTEAQLRSRIEPEKGVFICESEKVIRVALERGLVPISFLAEHKYVESQVKPLIAGRFDVPVYAGPRTMLSQLTGYELTRGVLCAMRRPKLPPVDAICRGRHRIAIMDSVVNSTNTGAIFRAATALGIEALLLTPTCCDPLNRRSVRVSMGTIFQMPWTYLCDDNTGWPHPVMERLHAMGFKTVALALRDDAVAIDDPVLAAEPRLAIIMGTEGDGLSAATVTACDYVAKIPMRAGVDSLNVAAAAAVAFWQLVR